MAELIDLPFPRKRIRWGAHWRYLGNMIELSLCGRVAALCQISLTTCLIIIIVMIIVVLHCESKNKPL